MSMQDAGPARERRVEKPWGGEVIWAEGPSYVGKILFVRRGEALSLQHHERKHETIRILSGRLAFEHGPSEAALERAELGPGDGWRIPPGLRHRMTALEDTHVLEVSTTELDDVVRHEDRYGRVR
jgi:mannose-6-phosphate isomerase-like protein (cupin superfamily)